MLEALPNLLRREPKASEAVTELTLENVEMVETPEAKRARERESKRILGLEANARRLLFADMKTRRTRDGQDVSRETDRMRNLKEGKVVERERVGEVTANVTEWVTMEFAAGERITAFAKAQGGELHLVYDETKKTVFKSVNASDAQGNLYTEYQELRPANELDLDKIKSVEGRRKKVDAYSRLLGAAYGIRPDRVPLNRNEFGLRTVDVGHAARAEAVNSYLDRLVGFGVIPVTVLREEQGQVSSIQEGVDGEELSVRDLRNLLVQGRKHPGAKSFMRLACWDYLTNSTDRHRGNIFYNRDTAQFEGIDNGYSLGYSFDAEIKDANGKKEMRNVPLDGYLSIPMEVVELDQEWSLDDEAVAQLKSLEAAVTGHVAYREGVLSPKEIAALPEDVKQGTAVMALSENFRLLYERMDEKGKVIPETTVIAKKEMQAFLARVKELIKHRRPPEFPKEHQKRYGLKFIIER